MNYSGSLTPSITAINPPFGNVKGNELIIISGSNFGSDASLATLHIDTIECVIRAEDVPYFSDTSFQCLTGYKGNL